MLGNDAMETVSTEVDTLPKNPRGELIDISSVLKAESRSKLPRRIDVVISTWICFSKSM